MSNNERKWFSPRRPGAAVAVGSGRGRAVATRLASLFALLLSFAPGAFAASDREVGAQAAEVGTLESIAELHRTPALNGGVEGGQPPYRIMRVYTGSEGVPGR